MNRLMYNKIIRSISKGVQDVLTVNSVYDVLTESHGTIQLYKNKRNLELTEFIDNVINDIKTEKYKQNEIENTLYNII